MGCTSSKPNIESSVPIHTPEKTQPSQPTSIPDRTTSTPLPRPGTVDNTRARAQSKGAAFPRRPYDGGRDYPPPSSVVNVFTSQHLVRQEMPSPQHPYRRRTTSRTRTRLVSTIDRAALQSLPWHLSGRRIWSAPPGIFGSGHQRAKLGAPLHSSGRRNRAVSTAVHGSGHQRARTKSITGLSSATSQIPAGRRAGRSRFPLALQSLLPNDFRYALRP